MTGPDGIVRALRFAAGDTPDLSVSVNGELQNVSFEAGPVLQAQVLPPVRLEAAHGNKITFLREGQPNVEVEADEHGEVEVAFPASGAWTAYSVREGRLFRAMVTSGAEPWPTPDWVAVPVRPVRIVDPEGFPMPGIRVRIDLFGGGFSRTVNASTDRHGVLAVPQVKEVTLTLYPNEPFRLADPVAPEALPEEITFLEPGAYIRRMIALGHGTKATPSVSGVHEVVSVEPGSAWEGIVAPGDLLPASPDALWAQARELYPLASVEILSRPDLRTVFLPGGPPCSPVSSFFRFPEPNRRRPQDPLVDGLSHLSSPFVCLRPSQSRGPRFPPRSLARAIEGQWVKAHIAARRSATTAETTRAMYARDRGSSLAAILAATPDPQERAEIAYGLQHGRFPDAPQTGEPHTLKGEPGIGWWVLARFTTRRAEKAVIPVSETHAVWWSPFGYEVLERP